MMIVIATSDFVMMLAQTAFNHQLQKIKHITQHYGVQSNS